MPKSILLAICTVILAVPGASSSQPAPAKIIEKVVPHYSHIAIHAGIEGVVVLEVPVDSQGVPGEPRVLVSPNPLLTWHTVWAARHSRYQAAHDGLGAVASSVRFQYEFVCPRDSDGKPVLPKVLVEPPKRERFTVPSHRICLYGHWLSGDVEVVQIENRVYVGGIRVYLPHYTNQMRREFSEKQQLEELIGEANALVRDCLILGYSKKETKAKVVRLFTGYPAKVEYRAMGQGAYAVSVGEAAAIFTIPGVCPPFDYGDRQEVVYLRKATDRYYSWVRKLESAADTNGYWFQSHFYSGSVGLNSAGGRYLSSRIAEAAEYGGRPEFRYREMEAVGLDQAICDMLVEQSWVGQH